MANGNDKTVLQYLREDIHDDIKKIEKHLENLNGRTRTNETKIAYIFGGMSLLGVAIILARLL